jgi:hypothetical protein
MRHEADGRIVVRTSSRWPPRADIGHTAAAPPDVDHVRPSTGMKREIPRQRQ